MRYYKYLIIFMSIGIFCLPSMANNALRGKSFSARCHQSGRQEFRVDKKLMKKNKETPLLTHQEVAQIIPLDMKTTNDGNQVRNRLLQNSATVLLKSPALKNSFLMKTAAKVENSTKMDVSIKDDNPDSLQDSIEHKFNFDVQALKGTAKITYSGLIDSKMQYQAGTNTFLLSLEEKLSHRSKIALSHLRDREQSRQLLQYQLSW